MLRPAKRSGILRRGFVGGLAMTPALAAVTPVAAQAPAAQPTTGDAGRVRAQLKDAKGTKLVLLGTGAGPAPTIPGRSRRMTANVMLSNGAAYILDCGLGLTNEFARTGLSFHTVRAIFITHHHPDHIVAHDLMVI